MQMKQLLHLIIRDTIIDYRGYNLWDLCHICVSSLTEMLCLYMYTYYAHIIIYDRIYFVVLKCNNLEYKTQNNHKLSTIRYLWSKKIREQEQSSIFSEWSINCRNDMEVSNTAQEPEIILRTLQNYSWPKKELRRH